MTMDGHQSLALPSFGVQRNLREKITQTLRAAVISGELRAGEVHSAPSLAAQFGVSATPVREAMLDLAKDGFVVAERNRGFRVVEMSDADLDEICQIRLLLEVPTTVQVARLISAEVLERLAVLADEIVDAASRADLIDYLDSDRRFHVLLISQLGNDRLTELVDRMRRQTRLFGLVALAESGVLVASAREHHELIEAMRDRDTARTKTLINSHIKHIRGLWVGRDER
jgi:DNA-binding GntR family transcriptional regulator